MSTPSTVLTRMQRDLRADITPDGARIPDDSVRFHMCHGPDRQVEVLREILCDLFDTDPTLQPRDVVVVCTDLTRYAPLLSAHLAPSDEQGLHPGHLLRARLSDSPGESNQIRDLLVTLLELPDHRATAADLVEISSIPAVAAHFDLEEDDLARLPELFSRAQIRWGIDAAQRRRQGLGAVRQGTWISGIDRLLAGIVLSDSPLTRIDTVVPVEHVEGSDVSLIGAIAELVSRIRMHLLACGEPASIATWTHRLESMLRDLVSPLVAEQNWQLNQVTSRLGELAQRCPQNSPVLSRNDIAALLRLTLPARHRSVVLGSGDLEICALGEMGRIPHRVVCLLGVDDQHLPRPSRVAGDDLLARPGVDCTRPDRAALDRQGLIDALMGATERLVIIGSGADPLTGAILPEPVIISDLLEATGVPAAQRRWPDRPTSPQMYDADALIRWHPLQPHSAANFRPDARGRTFSFDAQALKGALRLDKPVEQNPPRPVWRISIPEHLGGGGPASLRDVADFYQAPAASWFRHTFGFLPTEPRRELPVDLPVELDGLERFTLGTSMLGRLLDGEQPEHVVDAALLSGALPPGPPGIAEASSALPRLMAMVDALNRLRIQPTEADVLLDDDGIGVIGRITSYAGALVSHRYGRIRAKDLVAEWVTLLIAQSAGLAVDRAVLVGRDEVHTLLAPAGDQASIIAGQLLGVYLRGTHVFLPLPPETAHCQAQLWSRMGWSNAETRSWEVAKAFRRETQYSVLWAEHLGLDWDQLRSMAPEPADPVNNSSSRFVNLCSWLYLPLVNHHQSAPLHEFQCETSVLQGGC
ncbi:hypothetical protein [Propionibacterium sp.]|uniref:hypothetical protein n=1 Tax=Propionibacterium sp. TaxID=1977903 RepID=UPI0039EAF88D